MSTTTTARGVMCWRCDKKIAEQLGPGSTITCRHCGAKNRT